MKVTTLTVKKDGVKVEVLLTHDEEKLLLEYAINDLVEKGALSIIKDKQEDQVYQLLFEEVKGHA